MPAERNDPETMEHYLLLKHTHILLALVSGVGFGLRGFVRLILGRPLKHPVLKVAPHIIDTLLLASGVTLWIIVGWPLMSWLGLKLVLVIAYILIGIAAFRARRQGLAVGLYMLALAVFVGVAFIATYKPL